MSALLRLLIVDDDTGTIRVLSEILKDIGRIFFATNGDDAIAMVREKAPDIVLLDVEMPGLSGFQVCATIKAIPRFADIPVIFITALSGQDSETQALGAGAADFIVKPPNPSVVRARVMTQLSLKQKTDQLRSNLAMLKATEQALQNSNAELEHFAHETASELRQPLRMVSGFLGLLERKLGGVLDAEGREYLQFSVDGAHRMEQMIVGLLDYSQIGAIAGEDETVPLTEIIGSAIATLGAEITEARAEIAIVDDLPVVPGTGIELERLFRHLIDNAVKFRAPDGTPRIEIACHWDSGEWVVSIRDNGIGIARDQCHRLFKIFTRLELSERYAGIGMGLATCRKIAEQHGGRIWVEAASGEGSIFLVALPATSRLKDDRA